MEGIENITNIFKENGYKLRTDSSKIVISKSGVGSILSFMFMQSIAIVLIMTGLMYGPHYELLLAGIFFGGIPLLLDRLRYPNKIIIDKNNNEVKLRSGFTYTCKFRLSDISGLNVDESILTSDTSPFKEGYQDFIYSFRLNIAKSKVRFIKFLFRKQSDVDVSKIFDFLKTELRLVS